MIYHQRVLPNQTDSAARLISEQLTYTCISTERGVWGAMALAVLIGGAFHLIEPMGAVPFERLALFWTGVASWSLAAFLCVRTFRRQAQSLRNLRDWHTTFAGLFAYNGFVWGAGAFLLWIPGNDLNQFALLLLSILTVCNAVNEHGESVVFVGAIAAANAGMTALAFVFLPSGVALAAAILLPTGVGWFAFMALHARKRFAELVLVRLQNEDLATRAQITRDDALTLMAKAEGASNAKSVFLANMSHELRTPLNAIIGFSQIVRDELFGPIGNAKYKDYLGDIERSGQHLLSIINDILDIAKLEAGKIAVKADWTEPEGFLDDAIRLASGMPAAEGIPIVADYAHGTATVMSDSRMMRQAVLNLISNAVKHSPDKKPVRVRTRLAQRGALRIEIEDQGVGIPAAMVERVFEPFEQADNTYAREKQGTGLGLALVRAFVTAHAGRVWLESEHGRGTTAIIELPRTQRAIEAAPPPARLRA